MMVTHLAHRSLSPLRVVPMSHRLADNQLGNLTTALGTFGEFARAVQQNVNTGHCLSTINGKLVSPWEMEGELVASIQMHDPPVVNLGVKIQNLV